MARTIPKMHIGYAGVEPSLYDPEEDYIVVPGINLLFSTLKGAKTHAGTKRFVKVEVRYQEVDANGDPV